MKIKPIRSAEQHQLAKKQLKALISSNGDGSKSDDIEVLTAVLERYEQHQFAISPPSPLAAIQHRMEQRNLSPRDLEPFLGTRARVSEILSGKRSLSLDHIRSLHQGLSIPYESLIGKTGGYEAAPLEVSRPVLKKLAAIGFNVAQSNAAEFVTRAFGEQAKPALLARRTRTTRTSAKTDVTALLMWQASTMLIASEAQPKARYNPGSLTSDALRKIAQLSARRRGPVEVKNFLAESGIAMVINPTLPGTFLDGAAMVIAGNVPLVALTLRHDRVDNFWFTLLHELSHIALHFELLKKDGAAFFDDLDIESEDVREMEADKLAQESLIPSSLLEEIVWSTYSSNDDIEKLSQGAGVHMSIAAGRWQRTHADYRKFSRLIERNTLRDALAPKMYT
ncbi:MAG: ImmA/IrrE family metallo-endopeptidase [Hyphomicrobiaceae bacterium]|nr:ImmA/IrrE family metallo-endopeptidase [Hyphomicrobiaceae bacterium]